MRQFSALAAAFCFLAGAATAQIQPPELPGLPKTAPPGQTTYRPYEGVKPIQPFKPMIEPGPAADPFSPEAAARRQRQEAARQNGVFSPTAEAARARAEAKRDKTLNSPFFNPN